MKTKYFLSLLVAPVIAFAACSDDDYKSNDPDANPNTIAYYNVQDIYQDYNLFFKPKDGWVGDPMPFFDGGNYYVFYLHDARDGDVGFHPWSEATTKDFTSYTDNGVMIPYSRSEQAQDNALGTGSVFKHNGVYYGFYTGHNQRLEPFEKIMLATSTDLKTWEKVPEFSIEAPYRDENRPDKEYDRNDFRDPFVFEAAPGDFRMVITARAEYKGSKRGILAQYKSTDLLNWTLIEPFYDDTEVTLVECPDVFIMGDCQYVVYSNINDDDRKVHYKYRRKGNDSTPWIKPAYSAFDGRGFYAGKTASDGNERYIFGWCSTRDANNDDSNFSWAGSLVVHKLVQNTDGTLNVEIPSAINSKFSSAYQTKTLGSENVSVQANTYTLSPSSEVAYNLFDRIDKGPFKITTKIRANGSQRFGFEFGIAGATRNVFDLVIYPAEGQIRLERVKGTSQPEVVTSHNIRIPSDNVYDVTFVSENSVCVIYINGQEAFSNRIYRMNRNPFAIIAEGGQAVFSDFQVFK